MAVKRLKRVFFDVYARWVVFWSFPGGELL